MKASVRAALFLTILLGVSLPAKAQRVRFDINARISDRVTARVSVGDRYAPLSVVVPRYHRPIPRRARGRAYRTLRELAYEHTILHRELRHMRPRAAAHRHRRWHRAVGLTHHDFERARWHRGKNQRYRGDRW